MCSRMAFSSFINQTVQFSVALLQEVFKRCNEKLDCTLLYLYVLSPRTVYIVINFILSSLENDDMESSKRCVKLLSLIFILK